MLDLGNTVAWIWAVLALFGLFGVPALRGLALLEMATRSLARGLGRPRSLRTIPERPLELLGLSPVLADFARHTRIVALELRRCAEQAERWPDAHEVDAEPTWWSSLVGLGGFAAQTDARREVWDWLGSLERLPAAEREQLASLGIDGAGLREVLARAAAPTEEMRALAGLLWSIDERLLAASSAGYRGQASASLARATPLPTSADEHEEDTNTRERRRRWGRLLDEHKHGISRMAGSFAKSPSEREDLEQDIALALWQALPRFRGESSLKTFAYRVARYCCYRHLRRRGRLDVDTFLDEVGDSSTCIESWLSRMHDRARLEQALADLPEGLESTLALRLEGKSYAEIAAALGISEQNVSVRLTRARQRLAQHLVAA